MSSFTFPPAFPLVGLALSSAVALNVWQGLKSQAAREAAGILFPNNYATDAEARADKKKMIFNCTQRAHANTLENTPYVLGMLAFLGVYHPKAASGFTFLWVIGRVAYTVGYSTGDPEKRISRVEPVELIGLLGLMLGTLGVSATKAYQYVTGS